MVNEMQELNWFPEIVEAGPPVRFYLDSRKGVVLDAPSVEGAQTCNRDSGRTSDIGAKMEQV